MEFTTALPTRPRVFGATQTTTSLPSLLDQLPFRFLDLPRELRLMVYDYLIQPETVFIAMYGIPQHLAIPADMVLRAEACHQGPSLHLSVLRVCREIFKEAEEILYKPSTIDLCVPPVNPRHPGPGRPFPVAKLSKMQVLPKLLVSTKLHMEDERTCHEFLLGVSAFFHPRLSIESGSISIDSLDPVEFGGKDRVEFLRDLLHYTRSTHDLAVLLDECLFIFSKYCAGEVKVYDEWGSFRETQWERIKRSGFLLARFQHCKGDSVSWEESLRIEPGLDEAMFEMKREVQSLPSRQKLDQIDRIVNMKAKIRAIGMLKRSDY